MVEIEFVRWDGRRTEQFIKETQWFAHRTYLARTEAFIFLVNSDMKNADCTQLSVCKTHQGYITGISIMKLSIIPWLRYTDQIGYWWILSAAKQFKSQNKHQIRPNWDRATTIVTIRVHQDFKINISASAMVGFSRKFNFKNILIYHKNLLDDVYGCGNR